MKRFFSILMALVMVLESSVASDIVHSDVVETDYTPDTLRAIFTRKRAFWDTGERITVYIKPINSVEHSLFLVNWLGMTRYRYKKMLNVQMYSGKNTNVKTVSSDHEMLVALKTTPFAIGYLTDGTIITNDDGSLKLVVVFYGYE